MGPARHSGRDPRRNAAGDPARHRRPPRRGRATPRLPVPRAPEAAAVEVAEEGRLAACDCVEPEGPSPFEVDEGGISILHQACGKPPADDAWVHDGHLGPLPVTVRWEPDCTGDHHGACDCRWWPVYSPVPPTTVQVDKPMRLCRPDRKTNRRTCRDVITGQKETRRIVDHAECWQVTLTHHAPFCTSRTRWHTLRVGARW
ncbi:MULTISPECIES: hypothetical protein [unclassified Streptomyces]|uniref:hypothetical protein n=1 Tax=unclassified Streptomyces TaxID=2593676 RepID=UPI00382CF18F